MPKKLVACLLHFFIFLTFFTLHSSPTFASEFATDINTTVTVDAQGKTTVTDKIKITNLSATRYVSSFSLQLQTDQVTNITATPADTMLLSTQTTDNATTIIKANFKENVVGEKKSREFSISYHLPQSAMISDQTLLLRLPAWISDDSTQTRSITVNTPLEFGAPVQSHPAYVSLNSDTQNQQVIFENLTSAITLLYGQKSIYQLQAQYYFNNQSNNSQNFQLVLPREKFGQKVILTQLEPPANRISLDPKGELWVATYQLQPQEDVSLNLTAYLQIALLDLASQENLDLNQSHLNLNDLVQLANQEIFTSNQEQIQNFNLTIIDSEQIPVQFNTSPSASNLEFFLTEPTSLWGKFWGQKNLIIRNLTGQGWYNLNINATANNSAGQTESLLAKSSIPLLLPWQEATLQLNPPSFANAQEDIPIFISIHYEGNQQPSITQEVTARFIPNKLIFVAVAIISLAVIAGSVLVYRFLKKHTVRR